MVVSRVHQRWVAKPAQSPKSLNYGGYGTCLSKGLEGNVARLLLLGLLILTATPALAQECDPQTGNSVFQLAQYVKTASKKASVWRKDPLPALTQGAASQTPVLIHVGTPWCGPCRKMERDVLNKDALATFLRSRKVIPVKINGDKHKSLVKKLGVTSYPTDIIITYDAKGNMTMKSYGGPRTLRRYMDWIRSQTRPAPRRRANPST